MEQVFKTKRAQRWINIIVSLVVLIIFECDLEQLLLVLRGYFYFILVFYSQSKTIYIVKDNGVLEIKPGSGNRICKRNPCEKSVL